LPTLLRRHLGVDLNALSWKRSGDVFTAELDLDDPEHEVWLLRIPAGAAVPRHGHEGLEIGVVLAGACRDERGHFRCGDIFMADPSVVHGPVGDATSDCVCLMVMSSAGLRAEAGS
jgi:putative transcriptional regulator